MSGGHWEYKQYKIQELLEGVGRDGQVVLRFPKLAQIFRDLSHVLYETVHDLDWDLSGDSSISPNIDFESKFINDLGKIIDKKYTIRVYEVGE